MPAAAAILRQSLVVFLALFPIVNPVGTAPVFLSLTPGYTSASRRALARAVATNGFVLLIASILAGAYILKFFGISLPVVQVGGGLLVTASGWRLLNATAERHDGDAHAAARRRESNLKAIAFYPLTMPLTVGPGSISVAITLGADVPYGSAPAALLLAATALGTGLIGLAIFLSYRSAERLERLLGENGTNILVRLSSFILLCIGIQIFTNGATAIVRSILAAPK